jgi:hypothetical protein
MKTNDFIVQNCSSIMLKMEIQYIERNLARFNKDEIEGILIYLQSLRNELSERKYKLKTVDEVNLKLDELKKEFFDYLDDIHSNYSTTGEDDYNCLWSWVLTNFRINL